MQTRRAFLTTSAALTLGAPAVHALGANERLNIGLIGCGNRGRTIMSEAVKNKCRLVAGADCAKFRFAALKPALDKVGYTGKPEVHADYRELLDRSDIDAVIVATPDHHHKTVLLAAMAAGKHAYCEKPLSHTIEEGKEMVAAVRKAKRIVQ